MSPPDPPSPPSGPPSGLTFSRWTEAHPLPPSPAAACSTTRSTKVVIGGCPSCSSTSSAVQPTCWAQRPRADREVPVRPRGGCMPWLALFRRSRDGLGDRDRDDVDDPTLALAAEL